jgi:protein phosphatase
LRFRIEKDAGLHVVECPLSLDQKVVELDDVYEITATVVNSDMLDWWLRGLLELLQNRLATAEATASLAALLRQVQHDYVALSVVNVQLSGMASTLVGVRLVGNTATIFNVGDSRAYLLTGASEKPDARLLSRDHSFLNDLIDDGEITPVQASDAASFMRGLTAQFIADTAFDEFKVNIVTHVLQPGERLVLCSDGLNEVLSDTQIANLLVSHGEDDLLNACKASRRAGGTDDFSVIALEIDG